MGRLYVAHQHRLLSIPGFRASQRFETIHTVESPFVALHEVELAGTRASPFSCKGGPNNTGEWQARMGRTLQPLRRGPTPVVPMDARLVVVEEGCGPALPDHVSVQWMEAVGLDRSVLRRGLAVMPPATADRLVGTRHPCAETDRRAPPRRRLIGKGHAIIDGLPNHWVEKDAADRVSLESLNQTVSRRQIQRQSHRNDSRSTARLFFPVEHSAL